MPTSDHRPEPPAPAATPGDDAPTPRPAPLAALRDATVERLAAVVHRLGASTAGPLRDLVGDAVVGAGPLALAEGRAAVLGVGQGLRDGTAAVVEGLAGAAAMAGAPRAAARADLAADLRRTRAHAFAEDAHGLLAGELTAGATSAALQATPAIAALPLGPAIAVPMAGVVPAGIAATEERAAGADDAHVRRRGLEAGATAAAATELLGGAAAPVAGGVVSRLLAEPIAGLDGAAQAFARAATSGADRASGGWLAKHLPEATDPPPPAGEAR